MENMNVLDMTTEYYKAENSTLRREIDVLKERVQELDAMVKWFEEQNRLHKQKQFGRSSEQVHVDQMNWFDEAETESDLSKEEPSYEEITYTRKKKTSRKEKFEDLPIETIEYRLTEEEMVCPCCTGKLHEMTKNIRDELKIIPAVAKLLRHIQYIYACRNCEKTNITTPIVKAPMPKPAIPKSLASSSAIAYVIHQKYVNAMPLYRQEQDFKRLGIDLSRATLANWIIKATTHWFHRLYDRMKFHLVQKEILHADETSVQVLKEPGRKATTKSFMWLYRTGVSDHPIILYEYRTTRSGKCPQQFLKGFHGFLHVDAYDGYNKVVKVTIVACWAHYHSRQLKQIILGKY
jgi:transposase